MTPDLIPVQCPYCGEAFEIQTEPTPEPQKFIEDCAVCCRPIQFDMMWGDEEGVTITASRSNS